MNFASIAIVIFLFTSSLYILFFVLGVGGIANNRAAQGLDQNKRNNK